MNKLAEYTLHYPIPIFGVPLRGRNNPIYSAITVKQTKVFVTDKKEECSSIPQVSKLIDILEEELGENLNIKICIHNPDYSLPYISHYSISTAALSLLLSELFELDIMDITESLMGIEVEFFDHVLIQVIQALRLSIVNNSPLLYRYGEKPVIVKEPVPCCMSFREISISNEKNYTKQLVYSIGDYDSEIGDLVTKIAGLTVIKAYNTIHDANWDLMLINTYCRIENMLWYLEYSFLPPPKGLQEVCNKWIPNIGSPVPVSITLNRDECKGGVKALC